MLRKAIRGISGIVVSVSVIASLGLLFIQIRRTSMSINKTRPNTRCFMCGVTVYDKHGVEVPTKEGYCKTCYNKRSRAKISGKDPFRRK